MAKETAYLHTPISALVSAEPSIEALIAGTSAKNTEPPTAKELHGLHDRIRDTVTRFMNRRADVCNKSMRQVVEWRKEKREQEAERQAREQAAQREQEEGERKKVKREKALSKKRSHDEMAVDGDEEDRERKREQLPDVGAHGLARQDGLGVHAGELGIYFACAFLSQYRRSHHRHRATFPSLRV
jgi:transcriptional adapter 3